MGIPLYPQKDKTIFINIVHDTSSCIRFVALESVGKAASAHEGARFLSGYLDIFDPTKKTYVKWLWKATGYPLRQGIYRWNAVVLDTPDDYVCNGAFTAEMLNGVASRIEGMEHTTLAEQIALFMVGLLVSFASRNKKVIENDMAAPIATQSKIIPGMHRHYKGGVYDVLGTAIKSGSEGMDDEQPLVIYRPDYGDRGLRWRPLAEFTELIETLTGKIPRFAPENILS